MAAQSSTTLPAKKVVDAAYAALTALMDERVQLNRTLARDWQRKHWFMTFDKAVETLPPEYLSILENHRKQDEVVLRAILGLARAAEETGEGFTVVTTADDFRLIQNFYKGAK